MGTHCNDTYNFCENAALSNLKCVLVPRTKESTEFPDDWFVDKFQNATYTHHQKTVICVGVNNCVLAKYALSEKANGIPIKNIC